MRRTVWKSPTHDVPSPPRHKALLAVMCDNAQEVLTAQEVHQRFMTRDFIRLHHRHGPDWMTAHAVPCSLQAHWCQGPHAFLSQSCGWVPGVASLCPWQRPSEQEWYYTYLPEVQGKGPTSLRTRANFVLNTLGRSKDDGSLGMRCKGALTSSGTRGAGVMLALTLVTGCGFSRPLSRPCPRANAGMGTGRVKMLWTHCSYWNSATYF